jgi:hypothetical protein
MSENTLASEVIDTSANEQSQAERTYTQREVDDMMARTRSAVTKKVASKYEELGDPDELRSIVESHRKHQQDQQLKRGEFDKILQDVVSKKDLEIQKRDKMIETFKVETPIVDAAARYRAVNPEQVKALIRNQVRLNADGDVEVLDDRGEVKRDDNGRPVDVDFIVQDFLNRNPHFVQPAPSTTAARSSLNVQTSSTDLGSLDLKNPEHRKIYAEQRGFRK